MYKDEAIKIAETAEQGLGQSPLSPDELNERALLLPQGRLLFLGKSLYSCNWKGRTLC
jgi:insulysin